VKSLQRQKYRYINRIKSPMTFLPSYGKKTEAETVASKDLPVRFSRRSVPFIADFAPSRLFFRIGAPQNAGDGKEMKSVAA